jgi:hypothetical protein
VRAGLEDRLGWSMPNAARMQCSIWEAIRWSKDYGYRAVDVSGAGAFADG